MNKAIENRKREVFSRGTDAVLIESMMALDAMKPTQDTIRINSWIFEELTKRHPALDDYLDAWVEPDVMDGRSYAQATRDGLATLGVTA